MDGRLPAQFCCSLQVAAAARRMLEFFTAQINNPHTRRAYLNATRRFAAWCQQHRIGQLAEVQPVHVAAFIQDLQGQLAPATVKQHLAALRILFDWLVTGQVLELNPAHAVRGPKYSLKRGKTPVLTAEEARALLDSIQTVRTVQHGDGTETGEPLLVGLRDRALIGAMVYTFARVSAVLRMRVRRGGSGRTDGLGAPLNRILGTNSRLVQ